jgi:transcriptional regulator
MLVHDYSLHPGRRVVSPVSLPSLTGMPHRFQAFVARTIDEPQTSTIDFYVMLHRKKKPDALQGTLDLLVLKTLNRGPQHGYGIATHIEAVSDDDLRVEEGSLYPALHRMEQAGWVKADWQITENNRRARLYRITRIGQARLAEEQEKWDRLSKAVSKVLRFA